MYKSLAAALLLCAALSIHAADHAAGDSRLLIAGGSLTEIAFALGAENDIVAVDTSSLYPAATRALPKIGYYRALNVEGLLGVNPDKLLLLDGAGPPPVIAQLRALGLDMAVVKHDKSMAGLYATITEVGDFINKPVAATALNQEIQTALASQRQQRAQNPNTQPVTQPTTAVFLMSAGERGLMAAGTDTVPQLIFDEIGITNVFASLDGFKPVSSEALLGLNPDMILLASHTSRGQSAAAICDSAQLRLWAAQRGCQLHKVDSLKFLGLTPRIVEAIAETQALMSAPAAQASVPTPPTTTASRP